jgi:hypothetical protein
MKHIRFELRDGSVKQRRVRLFNATGPQSKGGPVGFHRFSPETFVVKNYSFRHDDRHEVRRAKDLRGHLAELFAQGPGILAGRHQRVG